MSSGYIGRDKQEPRSCHLERHRINAKSIKEGKRREGKGSQTTPPWSLCSLWVALWRPYIRTWRGRSHGPSLSAPQASLWIELRVKVRKKGFGNKLLLNSLFLSPAMQGSAAEARHYITPTLIIFLHCRYAQLVCGYREWEWGIEALGRVKDDIREKWYKELNLSLLTFQFGSYVWSEQGSIFKLYDNSNIKDFFTTLVWVFFY